MGGSGGGWEWRHDHPRKTSLPVLTVLAALVLVWYAAVVLLNAPFERDTAARAGTTIGFADLVRNTHGPSAPVLPAPHQVMAELWDTVVDKPVTSKRSLVYHAWITLSATLMGFGIGTVLGILLAVGMCTIVPWIAR